MEQLVGDTSPKSNTAQSKQQRFAQAKPLGTQPKS